MNGSVAPRSVLVGLLGQGVTPSLTPPMHEREGRRHGIAYVYRTVDLGPHESDRLTLAVLLSAARRLGFDGLNITHPAKQTVIPLLDALAPSARAVGAVNTVCFEGDKAIGHNTDVSGFLAAFEERLADAPRATVVLIGAGGAGAAVARALLHAGVGTLHIVDAEHSRASELAQATGADAGGLQDLERLVAAADGVVNATPMGMAAHPGSPLDPAVLDSRKFVADVVYRPVETELLREARARGCRVMSGLGMAMHQAADAFEIFTGETADRRAMHADLESLVAAEATGDPHRGHMGEEEDT